MSAAGALGTGPAASLTVQNAANWLNVLASGDIRIVVWDCALCTKCLNWVVHHTVTVTTASVG